MHKSTQARGVEQAEARAVLEQAVLQRAASEPHINIVYTGTAPARFNLLRELPRALVRAVTTIRSLPVDTMVRMNRRSRAGPRLSPAVLDCDRILVAVLITDIVDSTKRVVEIGDRAWHVLLDRHAHATRDQIKRFGGREVGSRGDGFVGIFDSPTPAVHWAAATANTIAPLGLLLRCGVHGGEVHLNNEEIGGLTAHTAARIAAAARPGEAMVSKLVRDLAAGSGLVFEYRGVHRLRGLPEAMHLYAMPGAAAPVATNIINLETRSAY